MFKKKFKVMVRHFYKGKYTVEYSNHRLIPIYREINDWFSAGVTSGVEGWSTKLFSNYTKAEEFAKKLKSIEDINAFYTLERVKEIEFLKAKAKYYSQAIPYTVKYIS